MTRRIVLAGGNGFIGELLVKSFVAGNYEVVILTRSPVAGETAIRQVRWDGIGTIKLIEDPRNICGHTRAFQSLKLIARAFLVARH